MTNHFPAAGGALQRAHRREIAAVDAATARGVHRVQTQVNKEIAAVHALSSVGAAADRLPVDLPDRHHRMALRIARTTGHLIGRLTR